DLAPVARPVHEDDGGPLELASLAERQDLEQLVERAEPAGKDDHGPREVGEPELAHEEVVELEPEAGRDVGIRALLVWEADVEPDRAAAGVGRSPVRRFHDAGSAAAADEKPPRRGCDALRPLGHQTRQLARL